MRELIPYGKEGKGIAQAFLRERVVQAQAAITKALGYKSQAAVNAVIRMAGFAAGSMFAKVFIVKRFDPSYARGMLNYRATASYERSKVFAAERGLPLDFRETRDIGYNEGKDLHGGVVMPPQPRPFVASGQSMREVLGSIKVEVRVTADRCRILVKCQAGAIKYTKQYSAFKRIAPLEYARVIDEFDKTMEKLLPQIGRGKAIGRGFHFPAVGTVDIPNRGISAMPEREVARAG